MEAGNALREGRLRILGDNTDVLTYIEHFTVVVGSTAYNADAYHALVANGWITVHLLADEEFDTVVFPCLESEVVAIVVPEAQRPAVRFALKKAAKNLRRSLFLGSGPAGGGLAGAAAGPAGQETGSVSSDTITTGESDPYRAKSGALSFVTKDGKRIPVQRTSGAIDRISANQHWIRIWSEDRQSYLLGDNIDLEPGDLISKLENLTMRIEAGHVTEGTTWMSLDRLQELQELRVTKSASKFDRFVSFEWNALYPLRLSITDFLPDNTKVDNFNEELASVSTRGALQRALQGLALAFHVLIGEPFEEYAAAVECMGGSLQGTKTKHVPDVYLIYSINAGIQDLMYSFKYDAPPALNRSKFTADGAFAHSLETCLLTAVSRLPVPGDQLKYLEFQRDIFPKLLVNRGKVDPLEGGESEDATITDRSRGRGARGNGRNKKRGADSIQTPGTGRGGASASGGSGVSNVKIKKESKLHVQIKKESQVEACPFYIAELLKIPTKNDPDKFITCRNKKGCSKGKHLPLGDLSRKEAVAPFLMEPVASFYVAEKALDAMRLLNDAVFKQ